MTQVVWTAVVSALSALVLGARFGWEVWLGMAAPLVVMSATWLMAKRVYTVTPERLTSVMIRAFAGKLVFFAVYVGLVVGVLGARPVPFALSFAGYFIVLHLVEALWLKRLFVS